MEILRSFDKLVTVGNFYSSNYIEYKSNGDSYKNQSIGEYLNKIKPYLKDIIDLQKFDTWNILINNCN